MAKDRKKLIHIHSSIPDKQPTPQSLAVGEIAVNNAADQEFLSIKNSEDKVKRFSSDEQMITWMEKKEVMPYVGYVRGGAGPSATSAATPTKDEYGSYGILDSDLSGNTSEIVIKLNQVAASATTKHERVNGSKDRYNKEVNPTIDSGVNDGAGFFIDMSRYAMQGANPEFSGITTTCYAVLNGRTEILGGTGTAGNCRSLLNIDVLSATTKASSAWTSASTAVTVIGSNDTTISGNTTLKVSGTTTETKKGNVTENNLANKTENTTGNVVENTTGTTTITRTGDVKILDKNNHYEDVTGNYSGTTTGTTTEVKVGNVTESHSGTTTENKKGDVTENNLANKTENTTGNVVVNTTGTTTETKVGNVVENHSGTTTDNNKGNVVVNNQANFNMNTSGNTTFTTTGDTVIHSDGAVGITAVEDIVATSSESSIIVTANDDLCETAGDVAAFKGVNKTNVGIDCSDAGRTKVTNVYGDTINERANTADTRVTSAYTSATTATTIIGTANTSATTADYSGNTLSSHVKSLTHSGDTLNITESSSTTVKSPSTTISGCTKIELITDELNFKQCTTGTVNFNFCDGFGVKSDDIKFEECTNNAGKIVIKENATEISGKTLTIRESGATDFSGATLTTTTTGNTTMNVSGATAINTSGTTTLTSTGNTKIETSGANNKVTVQATGTGGDVEVFAKDTLCMSGGTTAALVGTTKTNIGINCSDGGDTTTLNVRGKTTNVSATTLNETSAEATNINVGTNLTEKISGNTDVTVSGTTTIKTEDGTTIQTTAGNTNINTTGNTNITSTGTTTLTSTGTTTIEATGTNSDVCISATDSARVYGKGSTYVGVKCDGTIGSATTIEGTTLVLSGNTTNISGATELNLSGKTVTEKGTEISISGGSINETSTGKTCIQATNASSGIVNVGGNKATNIGVDCDGTIYSDTTSIDAQSAITMTTTATTGYIDLSSKDIFLSASNDVYVGDEDSSVTKNVYVYAKNNLCEVSEDVAAFKGANKTYIGNTCSANNPSTEVDINGTTINISGSSVNISGTTTISGQTTIGDTLIIKEGLEKSLSWSYGDVRNAEGDSTNFKADNSFVIPNSIDHLTNWNGSCIELPHNVCVTGTITASGAIYSSDRNLKENIKSIDAEDISKVGAIDLKSFNFIDDESKTKIYGVIAQEVQEAGLDILVHQKEDGMLGVDYTSFLILKVAQLQRDNNNLVNFVASLDKRVKELEEKLEKKD